MKFEVFHFFFFKDFFFFFLKRKNSFTKEKIEFLKKFFEANPNPVSQQYEELYIFFFNLLFIITVRLNLLNFNSIFVIRANVMKCKIKNLKNWFSHKRKLKSQINAQTEKCNLGSFEENQQFFGRVQLSSQINAGQIWQNFTLISQMRNCYMVPYSPFQYGYLSNFGFRNNYFFSI